MALLITYVVVNILISIYFERNRARFKLALTVHAAAFTAVLFVVLFGQQDNHIAAAMTTIFGEVTYTAMHEAIVTAAYGIISPLMIMEMIFGVLAVGISLTFTVHVVRYVISCKLKYHRSIKRADSGYANGKVTLLRANKIFRQNCVMRC